MGRDIFTKFSGFVGVRGPRKEKCKNCGPDPQFGRGGKANFLIGPRSAPSGSGTVLSRPASFCSHISQWAPLKHLLALAQNPWNISPTARQTRLQFWNFDFFRTICGAPLPQRGGISAIYLVLFLEPRRMNRSCKFCAFSSYGSEDMARQSWSQKIWAKNKAEKNCQNNVNSSKKSVQNGSR